MQEEKLEIITEEKPDTNTASYVVTDKNPSQVQPNRHYFYRGKEILFYENIINIFNFSR